MSYSTVFARCAFGIAAMTALATTEIAVQEQLTLRLGWASALHSLASVLGAHVAAGAIFGLVSSAASVIFRRLDSDVVQRLSWMAILVLVVVIPLPNVARSVTALWWGRVGLIGVSFAAAVGFAYWIAKKNVALFAITEVRYLQLLKWSSVLCLTIVVMAWTTQLVYSTRPDNFGRANVLLVSLDTVRADHLGIYGYERATAPSLASLAKESMIFDAAYAPEPWTLPSHVTMMTSLQPRTHGVGSVRARLDSAHTTLAETLQAEGYQTAAFVASGPASYIGGRRGLADGFHVYRHPPNWNSRTLGTSLLELWYRFVLRVKPGEAKDITDAAIDFLETRGPEPFFLFLHYYDAHSDAEQDPYEATEETIEAVAGGHEQHFDGCDEKGRCASRFLLTFGPCPEDARSTLQPEHLQDIINHYDAGIRHIDDHLARLFDTISTLQLDDDTLIIVTADHGEEFLEHGSFLHSQLYEEVLHVPLVIRLPSRRYQGTRIPEPVELVDIMPTILDAVSVEAPTTLQGKSLLRTPIGHSSPMTPLFFSRTLEGDSTPRQIAVRFGSRKLLRELTPRCSNMASQTKVFDLAADPQEKKALIPSNSDADSRLLAILDQWHLTIQETNRFGATSEFEIDPDERRRLEALGYVSR